MKVHVVDYKEQELNPKDILLVAAFEDKNALQMFKEPAKKVGMSPERFAFTVNVKEYSNPKLVRVRAGNTLFTIATFYPRVGYVKGYNADVAENYVNNIIEFVRAAREMGYDHLITHLSKEAWRAAKMALKRSRMNVETKFDSAQGLAAIKTGPERD
jgi:hypothetical protein